jgi:hypothetical protein
VAHLIHPDVPDASLAKNAAISLRVGQHLGSRARDGRKMEAGDKVTGVVRLSWHGGDRRDSPVGERGGNHGTRTVSLG